MFKKAILSNGKMLRTLGYRPIIIIMAKPLLTIIVAVSVLASVSVKAEGSMEEILTDERFWKLTQDQFMDRYKALGFRWNSEAKKSARLPGVQKPTFKGKSLGETIVSFDESAPSQVQISIYNRGDDGLLAEESFESGISMWREILTEITGVQPEDLGKDKKSAVSAERVRWQRGELAYQMEYSFQKEVKSKGIPFRSEFVRIRVAPYVEQSFMEKALSSGPKKISRADLPANVVRKDGDVFIQGLPMVDQGAKGYCVVASTARVFGYYDMAVDQHEIAQIANSSASEGTSTVGMVDALKDIAGRFKVRVKTHVDFDYDDMTDLTEDYNREAKRQDLPQVPENSNNWYNFDRFEPEVLRKVRLKSSGDFKRFVGEVERSIDSGVPLLWTVTVGIFEEPKRISQTRGGHMRIIIGYNRDKNEIIFTDSWGAGHEFKRWGVEEAFSSSKGMYSIQPTT